MITPRQSDPPRDVDTGATCRECVAGKHRNCTGSVLVDTPDGADTWVPCACEHCTSIRDNQTIATIRRRFRKEREQGGEVA